MGVAEGAEVWCAIVVTMVPKIRDASLSYSIAGVPTPLFFVFFTSMFIGSSKPIAFRVLCSAHMHGAVARVHKRGTRG